MTSNANPQPSASPVAIDGLTRRFRRKTALDGVSLKVPRGFVYGLVGENGAGKTTLIKHLLGLLKPQAGSVQVFGLDPIAAPEQTLGRIGYLSENRDMPNWMRVRELMLYTKAFYPAWDDAYAEHLRATFDLDPGAKIRTLSRGQRAQAGLLAALGHRPDLLILDEPSSGLDPIVRRDILAAIIRTVADEGRTVLFSSHLLDEVERVADHVAMIHTGRLVMQGPLDDIKQGHLRVTLRFPEPQRTPPDLPGALFWEGAGTEWATVCNGQAAALKEAAAQRGAEVLEEATPSLEEIFIARAKAGPARVREA